jgi:hypothetical protein
MLLEVDKDGGRVRDPEIHFKTRRLEQYEEATLSKPPKTVPKMKTPVVLTL